MSFSLGYDPGNQSRDTTTPVGIGNVACDAVLVARHRDGSNQLGDLSGDGVPYSDYTNYAPVNPEATVPVNPSTVIDPDRFQPVVYSEDLTRGLLTGPFLAAQWHKVSPLFGPYDNEIQKYITSHHSFRQ
jgi:hypothetical protein